MKIGTVGVIGAGQMGNGIAHVCALSGLDVILHDVDDSAIERGLATINGNLARQVAKGVIDDAARDGAMGRIRASGGLEALSACDLAIESATEEEQVKRKIFADVCPVLSEHAILATNTSSISITRLAASTDRPERFMGIHFMNPVPRMELVELVRGIATDEDTFSECKGFVDHIGKKATVAEDFPAFIVIFFFIDMVN